MILLAWWLGKYVGAPAPRKKFSKRRRKTVRVPAAASLPAAGPAVPAMPPPPTVTPADPSSSQAPRGQKET